MFGSPEFCGESIPASFCGDCSSGTKASVIILRNYLFKTSILLESLYQSLSVIHNMIFFIANAQLILITVLQKNAFLARLGIIKTCPDS